MFGFTNNHNNRARRPAERSAVLIDLVGDNSDEPRLSVDDAVTYAHSFGPDLTLDNVASIAGAMRSRDRRRFLRRLSSGPDGGEAA